MRDSVTRGAVGCARIDRRHRRGGRVGHRTDWTWVDPIIGAVIGVFILPRRVGGWAGRLCGFSCRKRPQDRHSGALRADLAAIPGVVDVHDLHVWTLTSEMEAASAQHHGESRARQPCRPGPGARRARRRPRRRARHAADQARRPQGLRRGRLVSVPLCRSTRTGLWCPLCGSVRGLALLGDGQVLAALGGDLLLLVTLPVLAWGAVAIAGSGTIPGPWVVPAAPGSRWRRLRCSTRSPKTFHSAPPSRVRRRIRRVGRRALGSFTQRTRRRRDG